MLFLCVAEPCQGGLCDWLHLFSSKLTVQLTLTSQSLTGRQAQDSALHRDEPQGEAVTV